MIDPTPGPGWSRRRYLGGALADGARWRQFAGTTLSFASEDTAPFRTLGLIDRWLVTGQIQGAVPGE
jgi:hypothetical protein